MFLVDLTLVTTNSSTDFKKGNCGDLRTGRDVDVDAVRTGDLVRATKVEFKKDKHDD
jgi:hypothetical protein